jgi:FKBP-type peptidyl-prolyl cis-trans isomerase SlyD
MAIRKYDYIEVDYTGKTKDEGIVFDTTIPSIAKENHLHDEHVTYKPTIVCVGKLHLLKGLDEQVIGKETGTYTFEVKDIDAFGKKNAKLLKLIQLKMFEKEGIKPFPGLDVNIDGQYGVVKNVSGGRVVVDFNHPLASKDLIYEMTIHRIIVKEDEKIKGLLEMLKFPFINVQVTADKAAITTPIELPEPIQTGLIADIVETTGIKTVEFKKEAGAKKGKEEGHSHNHNDGHNHEDHEGHTHEHREDHHPEHHDHTHDTESAIHKHKETDVQESLEDEE